MATHRMIPIDLAIKTRDKELRQLRIRYLVIKAIMYTVLASIALAAILLLTACGPVLTDSQEAMQACVGVINPDIRETCISNYVVTARAGRDAQWSAIGAGMLARPAATSCMNIGGIVTCR